MQKRNGELLEFIYEEIKRNNKITEQELAKKYYFSERTIRRYIKILKENKKIKLINYGKQKIWELLE